MRAGKAHGFALIDLIFVVGIIGVLASVGLPSMLQARQSAAGASAIGSMRSINSSELTFALTCGNGFYAPSLTSLGYPAVGSHEPFLGGGLTSADTIVKSAYSFTLEGDPYAGAPASCNGLAPGETAQGFIAVAEPTEPTNFRHFGTNASGAIYEHTATLYSAMPELGQPGIGHVIR